MKHLVQQHRHCRAPGQRGRDQRDLAVAARPPLRSGWDTLRNLVDDLDAAGLDQPVDEPGQWPTAEIRAHRRAVLLPSFPHEKVEPAARFG